MAENPSLSIIVTSYTSDRLKDIFELLESINNQTYQNVETVVVVEGSKDLYERVLDYAKEKGILRIKIIFNYGERGASSARNLGIRNSESDILAFVDDDVVLFPDWAKEMIRTYEDESIIGVTGPALPLWEDESSKWLPKELYWIIGSTEWFDSTKVIETRNVWTMNSSFRRTAFDRGLLFRTNIGPLGGSMHGRKTDVSEDVEFSLRVREETGKRIVFNPAAKVYHRANKDRLKWDVVAQWCYWTGFSKRKLELLYAHLPGNQKVLSAEQQLLSRILGRLLPEILADFFSSPIVALKRLSMTTIVLVFVAIGYSHALLVIRI